MLLVCPILRLDAGEAVDAQDCLTALRPPTISRMRHSDLRHHEMDTSEWESPRYSRNAPPASRGTNPTDLILSNSNPL